MEKLTEYLNEYVEIITLDNKVVLGILFSFDQSLNMILRNYIELEINLDYEEAQCESGVVLIRGSNVSCISLIKSSDDYINSIKNRTKVVIPRFEISLNS